ncbi:hypothetical protein AAIB41_01620 [Brucella sp. BE17]|uniref:hypothetical protein n=1 Tax=Brucella sp. BE17 TaxID=3142977 RepID=UPI0031B9BE89
MTESKRKSARRKQGSTDGGRVLAVLILVLFFLVGAGLVTNSIYHLLKATRPDDGIAFTGGFGIVFMIATVFSALHFRPDAPADKPLVIGAIAVSGFLLGLAGMALYYYARITAAGIFASFIMGAFLLVLAWNLWKDYVKKKYG